jgi:hypothetical protein
MKSEVRVLLQSVHATLLTSRFARVHLHPISFGGHKILNPAHDVYSRRFTRTLDISYIITLFQIPLEKLRPLSHLTLFFFFNFYCTGL